MIFVHTGSVVLVIIVDIVFQAPVVDMWHSVEVGVKVEVENTDLDDFCEEFPNSFWIASILRIEGTSSFC